MATPLTYQKIQTSAGTVSIPIYNPIDVAYPNLRVMTGNGLGAYDLVAISDALPLRIMTPHGIKAFNTVLISDGGQPPIVKDSFNKPNSTTTLGTTETGQIWQAYGISNVWGIQSNAAYPVTPVWDDPVYVDAGISDNVVLQMRINTTHGQQQIMWRIVDGNRNYFRLQGNEVRVFYSGGTSNYVLGTISPVLANGDVIRIELTGEKHVILVNNIPRLTFYDSTHLNGTKFGFSSNSTTLRIDDFLIEPHVPDVSVTNVTEDFLDDTYAFTYLQDPTYPWARFNTASVDGNLGHIKSTQQTIGSSTSNIIFDIHVPTGTTSSRIEVDYGVDSETSFDFLHLYLNGVEVLKMSGQYSATLTRTLTAGSYTLRVRYSKDGAADTGTDSAYISGIRLIHTI